MKSIIKSNQAVSPIIGVLLMVALTVILASVIGAFALGFGSNLEEYKNQYNSQLMRTSNMLPVSLSELNVITNQFTVTTNATVIIVTKQTDNWDSWDMSAELITDRSNFTTYGHINIGESIYLPKAAGNYRLIIRMPPDGIVYWNQIVTVN